MEHHTAQLVSVGEICKERGKVERLTTYRKTQTQVCLLHSLGVSCCRIWDRLCSHSCNMQSKALMSGRGTTPNIARVFCMLIHPLSLFPPTIRCFIGFRVKHKKIAKVFPPLSPPHSLLCNQFFSVVMFCIQTDAVMGNGPLPPPNRRKY